VPDEPEVPELPLVPDVPEVPEVPEVPSPYVMTALPVILEPITITRLLASVNVIEVGTTD